MSGPYCRECGQLMPRVSRFPAKHGQGWSAYDNAMIVRNAVQARTLGWTADRTIATLARRFERTELSIFYKLEAAGLVTDGAERLEG